MSTKSSSPSNTTTTQELPSWAQPYAQQLLERGSALSNQTTPTYNGQTVAGLTSGQQYDIGQLQGTADNQASTASQASNIANGLAGGSAYQVANPYTGNVAASTAANSYADPANNPYLASTVSAANKQLTDAYNNTTGASTLAQFRNAGAFGGSAQQQQTTANQNQLAQAVSDQTNSLYNSAYNTAAQVATQNAAQQNAVNLANQSVGTSANQAMGAQNSSNYYNYLNAQQNALGTASNANATQSALYGQALTGAGQQYQNNQDQLNAAYQQWLNQVNAPYSQLSTLSSALSGALGSGTGVTNSQTTAGSGSTLGSLLGLGSLGLGAYNAYNS